jgi:RNA polymerase sigma-70 factor (ECF subfamily)
MYTTSVTLLEQLHRPGEKQAWDRFVELYTPLLYYWASRMGLQPSDASDLVQDVFLVLIEKLPGFVYRPDQSFRSWLRQVTLNRWRDRCRRRQPVPVGSDLRTVADAAAPDPNEAFWEAEYRVLLARRALELMQQEFQPATWKACWETAVSGRPAAEVAQELGVSVDAVYAAKSRVLRRLRQQLVGLLD